MPKTLKEKLQIINDFIYRVEQPNVDSYDLPYRKRTDHELDQIVDEPVQGMLYYDALLISEAMNRAWDKHVLDEYEYVPQEPKDVDHLLIDYSYISKNKQSDIDDIKQKNQKIINDLNDPAKKMKLIEKKLMSMMSIDVSKFALGTTEERMRYMASRLNDTMALFQINDFVNAYKSLPGFNQEIVDLVEEKRLELQFLGGAASMSKYVSSPYYPLLSGISSAECTDIATTLMEFDDMISEGTQFNETQQIEYEFAQLMKAANSVASCEEQLFEKRDIYSVLAKNGVLDGGEDAFRFYPVNAEGVKISLSDAIDLLATNQMVTFRERSQEHINHIYTGAPMPEKLDSGRSITFQGAQLIETVEIPNPVESKLKAFENENLEREAALKWFNSLREDLLNDKSFDEFSSADMCRIKKIKLGGINRKNILLETNVGSYENTDIDDIEIDRMPALADLNEDQKIELFRAARNGELILNDPSMNPLQLRGLYVKDDGSCGVSGVCANIATDNDNLTILANDNPNIFTEYFPGASNAKELAYQYGDYQRDRAIEVSIESDKDSVAFSEKMALRQYEALTMLDTKDNPEFYNDPETADERRQLLKHYCKGAFADNNPNWTRFANVPEMHDVHSYKTTVMSLEEKTGMTMDRLLDIGLITTGDSDKRNLMYLKQQEDKPWDAVDRINRDINAGKNVYLTSPDKEGNLKEYKISAGENGLKFKEVVPVNDYYRARTEIQKLANEINATGVTKKDSAEFTALKNKLNSLSSNFPEDLNKFKTEMKQLSDLSDNYYFAKLGQSQNTRRRARFDISSRTRNIANAYYRGEDPKSEKELALSTIVNKARMQQAQYFAKQGMLTDIVTNKEAFYDSIEQFARDHVRAIQNISNLSLDKIKSIAKSDSTDVLKTFDKHNQAPKRVNGARGKEAEEIKHDDPDLNMLI